MKKMLWFVLIGVGAYVLWRGVNAKKEKAAQAPKLKAPLPAGAVLTGVTTTTENGRAPDYSEEVVGYGVRNWAQFAYSDGTTGWGETA